MQAFQQLPPILQQQDVLRQTRALQLQGMNAQPLTTVVVQEPLLVKKNQIQKRDACVKEVEHLPQLQQPHQLLRLLMRPLLPNAGQHRHRPTFAITRVATKDVGNGRGTLQTLQTATLPMSIRTITNVYKCDNLISSTIFIWSKICLKKKISNN